MISCVFTVRYELRIEGRRVELLYTFCCIVGQWTGGRRAGQGTRHLTVCHITTYIRYLTLCYNTKYIGT